MTWDEGLRVAWSVWFGLGIGLDRIGWSSPSPAACSLDLYAHAIAFFDFRVMFPAPLFPTSAIALSVFRFRVVLSRFISHIPHFTRAL